MMVAFLSLFAAGFVMVALRSAQQLNVQYHKVRWVIPTSLLMAFSEATIIFRLSSEWSFARILTYGFSAGLGCLVAMEIHKRLRKGWAKVE